MNKYICKLLYSPQYDQLMLAVPINPRSHWYTFWNDPWSYGGGAAHTMDFLTDTANFVLIDQWEYTADWVSFLEAREP